MEVSSTTIAVRSNDNYGEARFDLFELRYQVGAVYVFHVLVNDGTMDCGKCRERLYRLRCAVSRNDVELRRFDHKLAARYSAGKLSVHNQKTGPYHS